MCYTLWFFIGGEAPILGQAHHPDIIAAPPAALGRLLSQQHGFTDISNGSYRLFRVSCLHDVEMARGAMQRSRQFVRYGPVIAAEMQRVEESPLTQFVLITSITANEQVLDYFNYIP